MKLKKALLVALAALLLAGLGLGVYLFGGPFRFIDRPLVTESLQHLRSAADKGEPWVALPEQSAWEYLYWWPGIDRPNRAKIDVSVAYHSSEDAVVTVIDNDCQSDSTWRSCDRFEMHRQGGIWLPVRHQAAWQGRGRIGWTTLPTS